MVDFDKIWDILFSYETPKIVHINSRTVGVISRLVQLTIISYIIGYVLVFKKGYQQFCDVESSATTKVKGIAFTNFSDDDFNPKILNRDLYKRVWDVADYVVPPSENGAFFVTTNIVITSNQTQSVCAEDVTIPGAACDPHNNSCIEGATLPIGNGVMTGNCIPVPGNTTENKFSCEIRAWCPVEVDVTPLINRTALLRDSQDFTVLIKNFVDFPIFKNAKRRNIKETSNGTYLQNCRYNSETDPDCPVFKLGDIVKWAGQNYNEIAYKGGVIAIVIEWKCNLDWDKSYCLPSYTFSRLDDPTSKLAPGWNFRYANYFSDGSRTLFKVYGIKFAITVQGQAGKFFIVPLLLNVGAGLGLLALQVVICDLVVLYMVKGRHYYKKKKYEEVNNEADDLIIVSDRSSPSVLHSEVPSPKLSNRSDGYQTMR